MTEFATETIVMLCLGALIVALLHIALTKIRKDLPQQSVSFDQKTFFGKNPWIWVFMAISALLCVGGLLFAVEPASDADPGQKIVLILLILAFCLGTGCVEEGVFRGLLFAFPSVLLKKKFANKQYPPQIERKMLISLVMVSSLLFALCHVEFEALFLGGMFTLQTTLKGAEAFLFGVVMCTIYVSTKSLWKNALIHAVYDLVALAPAMFVAGGQIATYVYDSSMYMMMLGIALVTLILAAYMAGRAAKQSRRDTL